MTATLTSANTMNWKALASLAISAIGTNATNRSVTTPVRVIAVEGVPSRALIAPSAGGTSLSRAMAKGYRDAERTPAFAVLTRARTAATTTATTPADPSVRSAASAIGVDDVASTSPGTTPTITATMSAYRAVVTSSEPMMP